MAVFLLPALHRPRPPFRDAHAHTHFSLLLPRTARCPSFFVSFFLSFFSLLFPSFLFPFFFPFFSFSFLFLSFPFFLFSSLFFLSFFWVGEPPLESSARSLELFCCGRLCRPKRREEKRKTPPTVCPPVTTTAVWLPLLPTRFGLMYSALTLLSPAPLLHCNCSSHA